MFIFANLIFAVAQVLDYVLWAYMWILVGRIVVSLVRADYNNPIVRFLHAATEPYGPDGLYGHWLTYFLVLLPMAWLAFASLVGNRKRMTPAQ